MSNHLVTTQSLQCIWDSKLRTASLSRIYFEDVSPSSRQIWAMPITAIGRAKDCRIKSKLNDTLATDSHYKEKYNKRHS